jgi:hypothetical protein
MRTQIFLIALLAWTPVGSVICESSCAQSSLSALVAVEEVPDAPGTGASPCHGGGSPAPGSMPQESDDSNAVCLCGEFDRAGTATAPARGQGSVALLSAATVEVPGLRTTQGTVLLAGPPGHFIPPYGFRNPPLLI